MNESGLIRDLLSNTRTIAVFGYSPAPTDQAIRSHAHCGRMAIA